MVMNEARDKDGCCILCQSGDNPSCGCTQGLDDDSTGHLRRAREGGIRKGGDLKGNWPYCNSMLNL